MFTVAAFLPFLPLIEDAMIRQLGDDGFAKREAATRLQVRTPANPHQHRFAQVVEDLLGCFAVLVGRLRGLGQRFQSSSPAVAWAKQIVDCCCR
jgi:hypothetical protein